MLANSAPAATWARYFKRTRAGEPMADLLFESTMLPRTILISPSRWRGECGGHTDPWKEVRLRPPSCGGRVETSASGSRRTGSNFTGSFMPRLTTKSGAGSVSVGRSSAQESKMPIQITCSGSFNGQKARKLLVPLRIQVSTPSDIPANAQCKVRVSFAGSPTASFFSVQAIPGTWDAGATADIIESNLTFNPNTDPLPLSLVAFAVFQDDTNPTAPSAPPDYTANFRIEVFQGSVVFDSIVFVLPGSAAAQQSADVVFALDHGSSMNSTVVTPSRLERLKSAFPRAVALLRGDDTLGVSSFANLGLDPTLSPDLQCAKAFLTQRNAATSLSDGLVRDNTGPLKPIQLAIEKARVLSSTATLVLITDGSNFNTPKLSTPQLPTSALIIGESTTPIPSSAAKMVSQNGCYMYATTQALGDFAIEKLLTQLLIGINGRGFISDPEGSLRPGESVTFPIHVTEADRELEAIVFYPHGADPLDLDVNDLQVSEPPASNEHHGHHGHQHHHEHHAHQQQEHQDRHGHQDHSRCDDPRAEPDPCRGSGFVITRRPIVPERLHPDRAHTPTIVVSRSQAVRSSSAPVRFNLMVVAKTDLRLDAEATASGLTVGSDLLFSAALSEYGQTWDHRGVNVHVELTHPDGGVQTLHLEKTAPGRFQTSLRSFRAGAYTAHFIATGKSLLHRRTFRRECLRTVAVFPPGECCNSDSSPSGDSKVQT